MYKKIITSIHLLFIILLLSYVLIVYFSEDISIKINGLYLLINSLVVPSPPILYPAITLLYPNSLLRNISKQESLLIDNGSNFHCISIT